MQLSETYRRLVVITLVLFVLRKVMGEWEMGVLPTVLRDYSLSMSDQAGESVVESSLMAIILGVKFVSLIGLLFLKNWARLLFTAAWLLDSALGPLGGPYVAAGITQLVSEMLYLCAGAVLCLMWFTNLRTSFSA
jgi:hypothetical protein